jgi:hypothetical protein
MALDKKRSKNLTWRVAPIFPLFAQWAAAELRRYLMRDKVVAKLSTNPQPSSQQQGQSLTGNGFWEASHVYVCSDDFCC